MASQLLGDWLILLKIKAIYITILPSYGKSNTITHLHQ